MLSGSLSSRVAWYAAWVVALWIGIKFLSPVWSVLSPDKPQRYNPDFKQLYFAGRLMVEGQIGRVYDRALYPTLAQRSGVPKEQSDFLPMIRPAFAALYYAPFGLFSYRTGMRLALFTNFLLLGLLVWKLPKWFSVDPRFRICLIIFLPFLWSIGLGHDSLWLTLIVAYGLYLTKLNREAPGGMVLALSCFKPHLMWAVPLALFAAGKRKAACWFMLTGFGLAIFTLGVVGTEGVRQWIGLLQDPAADYLPGTMGNARALGTHFGSPYWLASSVLSLACLAVVLWRGCFSEKVSAAIIAGLLISPHTYLHDYSLLALVAMLATHPIARALFLFPWPFFYPYSDLLPFLALLLGYLCLLAVKRILLEWQEYSAEEVERSRCRPGTLKQAADEHG